MYRAHRAHRRHAAARGSATHLLRASDTPPGVVEARRQSFLHRLADRDVLDLDLVAETLVLLDARQRLGVLRVVVVEFDAAPVGAERQDAIGLQPPGHDVQHHVRVDEVIERLAVAVDAVVVAQRRMLQRVPGEQLGVVSTVIEHPRQPGMHDRQVIALEEVVDVDLPVAGHLPGVASRIAQRGQIERGDALDDAAIDLVEARRVVAQCNEHESLPFPHPQRRQADVPDVEICGILHLRCAEQLPLLVVEPAVVLAAHRVHAAATAMSERTRAVPADVREGAQHPVTASQQQHRRSGHLLDDMVARLGQLPVVGDHLPGPPEDAAAFAGQHLLAEVVSRRQRMRGVQWCHRKQSASGHSCVIRPGLSSRPGYCR